MPHSKQEPAEPTQEQYLTTGNEMQIGLMAMYVGDPAEWIERYAKAFRELITERPELYEAYIKDREECLTLIAEELNKRTLH